MTDQPAAPGASAPAGPPRSDARPQTPRSDAPTAPVRITAAVCTRGRPEGLLALLRTLDAACRPDGIAFAAVVAENEPAPTDLAGRVAAAGFGFPVAMAHEPRPGIPQARNRSVAMALAAGTDWLLFLDDDEEVPPEYFTGLAAAMAAHPGADVILGPVHYVLDGPRPPWLKHVRTGPHPEGAALVSAPTHNTLVQARLFAAAAGAGRSEGGGPEGGEQSGTGLRFDERLALTGGSDVELFSRAHAAGARIVWSERFAVSERWGPKRLTMGWHLRRKYRETAVELVTGGGQGGARALLRHGLAAPATALVYGLSALAAWPGSRDRAVRQGYRALAKLAEAAALFAALTGRLPRPYARTGTPEPERSSGRNPDHG